jgi:hypothetical protein
MDFMTLYQRKHSKIDFEGCDGIFGSITFSSVKLAVHQITQGGKTLSIIEAEISCPQEVD